jgi:glutamate--cysteine ligase
VAPRNRPMIASRVDRSFERRLAALVNSGERSVLQGGRKGIEKESLRVSPRGRIAGTRHPLALGSALTNPSITTDYSEALIELITPAFTQTWELLQFLTDLHQFVYRHLGDELLWATSMPCALDGDASIPIAEYGSSNIGRMKHVYRVGLGLRYGRVMQAISGVHFNYSFPERLWPVLHEAWRAKTTGQAFIDAAYFALLRNYHRHGWLVHYLFGASPAMCTTFFKGREAPASLQQLDRNTYFAPYATSLRMSDLGYRNKSQAGVSVSTNSLDQYVRDLSRLITTPSPEYQQLGVKVDGEWRQLNANVLQIENEYYSFIRPKRTARSGERPTRALSRAGVEYVEMRSLDVGVFDPVGVNQNKMRFLEAFAGLCVLKDSPPIDAASEQELDGNHLRVASRGREPGLTLSLDGRARELREWAATLLEEMQGVCELLDAGDAERPYTAALAVQQAKVADVEQTPSARLLRELETQGEAFFHFALRMSRQHRDYFRDLYPPNAAQLEAFGRQAEESLEAQRRVEQSDRVTFDEFVANWFAA